LVALDLRAGADKVVKSFSGNSDLLLRLGQGQEADVLLDVVEE
jgi:hypothetical protein